MERSETEPLLPAAPKDVQEAQGSTFRLLASSSALIAAHLALGTILFYHFQGADPVARVSVDECFYFAVTTFLTIGYGDIAPGTAAAKLFFMIYIFGSLAIQATVGGSLIASCLQVRQEQLPQEAGKQTDLYFRTRPKFISLAKAVSFLLLLMLGGAAMLTYSEGKSWIDSFYWACVTLTTVGFGDITPAFHKGLFALYFLVGVITFTYVFAESINIVLEVQLVLRLRKFFEQGVTEEMLARMDRFHDDGEVNRDEFIIFMLQEMNIASDEQIERIIGIFDALDLNGDGVLNTLDIRKRVAAHPALASFTSMRAQNTTIRRGRKFERSQSLGVAPEGPAARGRSLGVTPESFAERAITLDMIPEASDSKGGQGDELFRGGSQTPR